jgi:pyruvate kinase
MRRTKIIATLGPASQSEAMIKTLIEAGVNVFRINFSHQNEASLVVKTIRKLSQALNHPIAIMADLQGPKIRIGRFKSGHICLEKNQPFTLNCTSKPYLGDEHSVFVTYPLHRELTIGNHLLLDDGLIELVVQDIQDTQIICTVLESGELKDNKGVNLKGGGLAARTLTPKDLEDLNTAVELDIDYLTLSFVKDASDIHEARLLIQKKTKRNIPIIAKIERHEALTNITEIILAADAIMVARGDLGVEMGAAELPAIQKQLIKQGRQMNKITITATQMMESMIHHPQPTRAEVSDVANAILDGTDAVMLSAETATGKYPVKVIEMVSTICERAEKYAEFTYEPHDNNFQYERPNQVIAMAAMFTANHFPVKAIAALTESGSTAIWMSRQHSSVPIFAITADKNVMNQLSLVNNVYPLYFNYHEHQGKDLHDRLVDLLKSNHLVKQNDTVLLTRGEILGLPGRTNSLTIISI